MLDDNYKNNSLLVTFFKFMNDIEIIYLKNYFMVESSQDFCIFIVIKVI